MLIVRDLVSGPKRTTELLDSLHPISSRTLVGRLRDMEIDALVERRDFGGSPPHVEYNLSERGLKLVPLVESLKQVGEMLDCSSCEDRYQSTGRYCPPCPQRNNDGYGNQSGRDRSRDDDSIVLL